MNKQTKYYLIAPLILFALLIGQFFVVNTIGAQDEEPAPVPTPVCEGSDTQEQVYLSEDGECVERAEIADLDLEDSRVPTAIKLVSTGTEVSDPVSTAGILTTFLILIGLTVFWLTTIKSWNQ